MNTPIDRAHLRQVRVGPFEIQVLTLLKNNGGEYPMPETVDARAGIATMRDKGLVHIVERFGERHRVRLTDQGRQIVSQLDTMSVQPKQEIGTTHVLAPDLEASKQS